MTIIMPIGIDLLIFSEYLAIYHKRKCGLKLYIFLISISVSVINTFIYFFENPPLIQLVLYILIFPIINLIYRGDFLTKYLRWLVIVLLTTGFTFIPLLFTLIFDASTNSVDNGIIFIISYIFSRIIIYLLVLKIRRNKQIQYLDIKQYKSISIKTIIISIICIILYYIIVKALLYKTISKDSLMVFISLITLFILLLLNLYFDIYAKSNELIKKNIINKQKKIELDYASMLELKMENLRRLKHDMKNHISMISYFTNNDNFQGLKDYLCKLQVPLEPYTIINIPNFPELSALLNSKFELAKLKNIELDFDTHLNKNINIELYDLSLIFSNVLDNAIEASLKLNKERRKIYFYVGIINDYLIIDGINKFNINNVKLKNGKYITSKNNTSMHGKGIRIIEEIANKYDGDVNIEIDGDLFKTNITLNNNYK